MKLRNILGGLALALLTTFAYAASLVVLPQQLVVNSSGVPRSGAKLYVYVAGTTTPLTTYTTIALTTPHANPVLSVSSGLFPAIYADPDGGSYKLVLKDSANVTIYTEDNIPAAISQAEIGASLYPRTTAEIAAGITPTNYAYAEGNVLRYGNNTTPGTTDMAAALQDAVDVAEAGGTRVVRIPAGTYLLASPVAPVAELFGLQFIGDGPQVTTLTASHSSGPVLRINRSNSVVKGLNITATSARTNGAAGTNYGLLVEAPDTASKAVAHFRIDQVIIQSQPSHGYIQIGPSTNGFITQLQTQSNKGHGAVFDTGIINARTNKGAVGQIEIVDLWSFSNGGNGLVIGNPADTTAAGVPYRFLINNLELVGNATDAAVRLTFHEAWIHSENTRLQAPALNGATTHGALRFSGRDLQVENARFVDCTSAVSFGADPVAGQFTQRIQISNFRALNVAMNPAFIIENTTNVSNIRVQTASPGNITSWFTAGAVQATVNLTESLVVKMKTADETVNNVDTVQNDDALLIPLAASETVAFEALLRVNGNSTADIKLAFTAPAGATIRWAPTSGLYVGAADTSTVSSAELTEGSELAFGVPSGATRHVHVTGRVVMSTTEGNLQLKWAQNTITVGDTSVLASSWLKVIRGNSL